MHCCLVKRLQKWYWIFFDFFMQKQLLIMWSAFCFYLWLTEQSDTATAWIKNMRLNCYMLFFFSWGGRKNIAKLGLLISFKQRHQLHLTESVSKWRAGLIAPIISYILIASEQYINTIFDWLVQKPITEQQQQHFLNRYNTHENPMQEPYCVYPLGTTVKGLRAPQM